jgi:hypothetical protein
MIITLVNLILGAVNIIVIITVDKNKYVAAFNGFAVGCSFMAVLVRSMK